jgi:hypothetical protein
MSSEIIIFKNDAVGDLTHSLHAINNIIINNKDKNIIIYLSDRSKNFSFLINNKNITFKIVNYNLTLIQKIQIFCFILVNNISKAYILTPKSFYFLLPPLFRKTKFYGLCINGSNNYKRPPEFLRKYLFKYVINDRSAIFKRDSTEMIQYELTKNINQLNLESKININVEVSDVLKKYLPKDYCYFHLKKQRLDALGWGISEIKLLLDELLKYSPNIVITKDIEVDENSKIFKENFNSFDFKNNNYLNKNKKVIFLDNIDGEDIYNVIKLSKKIIAFHGMMTSLGAINKKNILDLYYCNINNWNDYRNYRNSFYEFKPNYNGYDFIIPSKDIKKSLRKMKFSLRNLNE